MPQNQQAQLRGWVLDAIDSLNLIDRTSCLIDIAIEQLGYSPGDEERAISRAELLLSTYTGTIKPQIIELRAELERMRDAIAKLEP